MRRASSFLHFVWNNTVAMLLYFDPPVSKLENVHSVSIKQSFFGQSALQDTIDWIFISWVTFRSTRIEDSTLTESLLLGNFRELGRFLIGKYLGILLCMLSKNVPFFGQSKLKIQHWPNPYFWVTFGNLGIFWLGTIWVTFWSTRIEDSTLTESQLLGHLGVFRLGITWVTFRSTRSKDSRLTESLFWVN